MFIKPNTNADLFLEKGTLRIYVGTHTQIIKKLDLLKSTTKRCYLCIWKKAFPP